MVCCRRSDSGMHTCRGRATVMVLVSSSSGPRVSGSTRVRRCFGPHPIPRNAARVGSPRPATIMATTSALPRLLMATISPVKTWMAATQRHNRRQDRGDTPSSYHARALGTVVTKRCLDVPPEFMAAFGRDVLLSGSASPVLRRWLGLTPERPALLLRGSPRRPTGGPESGL